MELNDYRWLKINRMKCIYAKKMNRKEKNGMIK